MDCLYMTLNALIVSLKFKLSHHMLSHHDPKREVNSKKGPRCKHEQKISVKSLSVTWRQRANRLNMVRFYRADGTQQTLCSSCTCWYVDILVECARNKEKSCCLKTPCCQCECGYFW